MLAYEKVGFVIVLFLVHCVNGTLRRLAVFEGDVSLVCELVTSISNSLNMS